MTQIKFRRQPGFNTLVDELLNGMPVLFNDGVRNQSKALYVPVNITEEKDSFVLEVVAPGFEKQDFKVNLEDNILTIAAEVKKQEAANTVKQIRNEFRFSDFKRSFTIDEKIDATSINASYVNGVLRLNLPKKKEVKEAAKEITIN